MVPGGAFANPTGANASRPPNFLSPHHQGDQSAAPGTPGTPEKAQTASEPRGGVSCSQERRGAAPPLGVSQCARCAWGAPGTPAVAASHGRAPAANSRHPGQSPTYLLFRLLPQALGGCRPLLYCLGCSPRRDVGIQLCASPATPLSAAPSPAVAFLFLLLYA